ncbi:hypothetical protein C0J52_13161 [Blattella germanica]|nr:hypothetical protein C0J52_13161 [Blattella germanica]
MRGKCSAVIHLARNTHEILKETEHSHGPDWGRCKATEVISALEEPGTSNYTRALLINRHTSSASTETYRKLPTNESVKRTVQRVRQGNLPPIPKSLTDVTDIPDIFKIDKDGE